MKAMYVNFANSQPRAYVNRHRMQKVNTISYKEFKIKWDYSFYNILKLEPDK